MPKTQPQDQDKFQVVEPTAPGATQEAVAALLARISVLERAVASAPVVANLALKANDADESLDARKPGVATPNEASTKARFRIIIEESDDQNAQQVVPVGVNGRLYTIVRGAEVDVPPEVLEVLDNAVNTITVPVIDQLTGMVKGSREKDSKRFPYQYLGQSVDSDGNPMQIERPRDRYK